MLEFPGTYYLAYRDLPGIIARHVQGRHALDFGCGAGRSTRFLSGLGFHTVGIDVSAHMVDLARKADPAGEYHVVGDGDYSALGDRRFDLILSAFPFDNIPGSAHRARLMIGLRTLLNETGRLVLLGSRPEIYVNEWASFSTADFPENRAVRSGEFVRIVSKDIPDRRPVLDVLWTHENYVALFDSAGLRILEHAMPLGKPGEREWMSETRIAPWTIYVCA